MQVINTITFANYNYFIIVSFFNKKVGVGLVCRRGAGTSFGSVVSLPRAVMPHSFYVRIFTPKSTAVRYCHHRLSTHPLSTIPFTYDIKGAVELGENGLPLAETDETINEHESRTFTDLGVTKKICNYLSNAGIVDPNSIQKLALPKTLKKVGKRTSAGSCIIQSETGSGKTLTYLIPALQDTSPGLTSLIVAPTRELAVQVCYWAQKLGGTGKTRRRVSLLVSGKTESSLIKQYNESKPHVLIGTPKILHTVMEDTDNKWELFLNRIVLDEADSLLEPLSPKATQKMKRNRLTHPKPTRLLLEDILKKVRKRNIPQMICTSATIPTALQQELVDIGWAEPLEVITTNKVRKQVPQVIDHTHIMCDKGEGKLNEIVRHFTENGLKSALVFVHRDVSVMNCVQELRDMGVATEAIYTHLDNPLKLNSVLGKFESGEIQLMVGNEETVRGLDFPFLETVYLTEVPRNATEYLHSSGRVGRCGQKGHVIVMIETSQETSRMNRIYSRLSLMNSDGGES